MLRKGHTVYLHFILRQCDIAIGAFTFGQIHLAKGYGSLYRQVVIVAIIEHLQQTHGMGEGESHPWCCPFGNVAYQ